MSDTERFRQDVKAAMEKAGISQVQLSSMTGITQAHLSRLLAGERTWKERHISRVSCVLKLNPVRYWSHHVLQVPLMGTVANGVFTAIQDPQKPPIMFDLEWNYCLHVIDDSLFPPLSPDTYLYVQEGPESLEARNIAVYMDSTGAGRLYYYSFADAGPRINLQSLNPEHYPDIQLPSKHLAILDRVVAIIWP